MSSPPRSRRRSPARIVPLKPSALLEQLAPRERELVALVARTVEHGASRGACGSS